MAPTDVRLLSGNGPLTTWAVVGVAGVTEVEVAAEYRDGRVRATSVTVRGDDVLATSVAAVPVGRILASLRERWFPWPASLGASAEHYLAGRSQRLGRPTGADAFYRDVGGLYRLLVRHGVGHPAAAIATTEGVPVTTVHRWIREARRHGHLPPGRKGSAG